MTSAVNSEDTLVRYLLGRLSAEENESLEKRYFADEELYDQLLDAEADLADAFVRGEMSDEDRRAFEERLPASPRLRERVAFARTFHRRLQAGAVASPLGEASRWSSRRWLPLAATVVLVLSGILLVREAGRLRGERESLLAARAALEDQIRRLERDSGAQQERLAELSRRLAELQASAAPVAAPPPRVISFALAAGLLRDTTPGSTLLVPAGTDAVDLEAPLEVAGHEPYRATLSRPTGETLFTATGLTGRASSAGVVVVVRVPARVLAPGDYVLTVQGVTKAGKTEDVGDYSVRVGRRAATHSR